MAAIRKKKHGGAINWDPLGVGQKIKDTFTPALGNQIVDDLKLAGHYAVPAATGALGGAAGEFLGGPLGGVAGSALGSYAGSQINNAIGNGLKRARGRPKKGEGLASQSMAYKRALKNNFNGLTVGEFVVNNAPVRDYHVNPHVRPSSSEMTLSPYAGINSPAMNPFVPTNYAQMGGTSSGYGGCGIHNKFGHSRHMAQPMRGVGLYGP
jgi:hypothetical protein